MLPWATTYSRSSGESTLTDETPAALGCADGTPVRVGLAAPPAPASSAPPITAHAAAAVAVVLIRNFPSVVGVAGHRDRPGRSLRTAPRGVGGEPVRKRLRHGERGT